MKRNKKAISLIVLVITIIVMVILAGAIVLTLNNSGIIQRASEAVDATNEATAKEVASLAWAEAYADGVREQADLEEAVMNALEEAKIDTEGYYISVTTSGVSLYKSVIATVDGVPIPKGFVASGANGENTKAGGLVIYEGSEAVTDTNVEPARRSRNQYVWVPVDTSSFDTTFVRGSYNNTTYANVFGENTWEVVPTTQLTTENLKYLTQETLTEVQEMYASVEKYGGFYIARYEAGIDTQRTAMGEASNFPKGDKVYSVMGKIPYTFIPWANEAYVTENNTPYFTASSAGAVTIARGMYPKDSNYGAVSTLPYGVQWDAVLNWWLDTNAVTSVDNSVAYGNHTEHVITSVSDLNADALVWDYSTSSKGSYVASDSTTLTYPKANGKSWALSTGALKAANVNNIYDLAGNVYEWTMEGDQTNGRVLRGGAGFGGADWGEYYPVSMRFGYHSGGTVYDFLGFRTALYIK